MNRRSVLSLLLLTRCASAPSSAAPPPASEPGVVIADRKTVVLSRLAGGGVTRRLPDGRLSLHYEHLDNGRGPTVDAQVRLAPDGTLSELTAKGRHTLGTPIDERFWIEDGVAKWKSHEESGEQRLEGPAFYLPMAALPELSGYLLAALRAAGGKIALLPGGEARLEPGGELTVKDAQGAEVKLVAHLVSGAGFVPEVLWTDAEGTFVGVSSSWWSYLPEALQGAAEVMAAFEKELLAARDRGLAEKLGKKLEAVVIQNARVLDVERGAWMEGHGVVVAGGKITAVGPSKKLKVPKGAEVIDAKGQALIPGLWDMHAHFGDADGVLNIASGVTTARDLGNDPDKLDDYKRRIDGGLAIGPRILRSGFIEGRGEKAAGSKITATTEEEAKAAVDYYASRGYEGVKIYNSMKPEIVPVIAKLAHERGMRVSGHVPMHMLAEDAVKAGYDEIQHVNMLFLNFLADRNTDTRTPLRFSIVGEKAAGLDLSSQPVQDFLALLIEKKTAVDPTLNAFEGLLVARPGKIVPGLEPLAARLPPQVQRWFVSGGMPVAPELDATYLKSFEQLLRMVRLLVDKKIPVVAGTDNIAGLMLHHELGLYARAGIPTAEVLRIATIHAARLMKLDAQRGTIAAGKDADLVLIDGDPLARIGDLGKTVLTLCNGRLYRAAELYPTIGVRP